MRRCRPPACVSPAGLACYVTDANWAKTLKAAPLDHGAPNFGMQDYWDKIEQDMNNTVSGQANTITIANLAERTQMAGTIYRADTLDELADLLGYKGAAKQNFLDSIAHYNELCYAGVDSDYGKDAPYMVPIDTAPFFGGTSSTGHSSNPMMVTMSGVITDETQGRTFQAAPFPAFIDGIIESGGLLKSLKARGVAK